MRKVKAATIAGLLIVVLGLLSLSFPQFSPGHDNLPGLPLRYPVALAQNTAFPVEEAGLAYYVNVGSIISSEFIHEIAESIPVIYLERTDRRNFIWIRDSFKSHGLEILFYLYFDTNGWIVSFFPRGVPSARLIQWSMEDPPRVGESLLRWKLERVLEGLSEELGKDFWAKIEAYHFGYPEAEKLIIAAKYGPGEMSFFIPEGLEVMEASLSMIDNDTGHVSSFFLAGKKVAEIDAGRKDTVVRVDPGVSYKLEAKGFEDETSVALVLLVKTGETEPEKEGRR